MARRRRVNRHLRERRERKYRLQAQGKTHRFIPDADSDFALMAKHFANHAAAHAERFSVSPEQAETLKGAVEHFREALSMTIRRDSAGPRATRIKNDARAAAERKVREVAKTIRGTAEAALTGVDRFCLNLPERKKRAKARVCPQIAPVLRYVGATHEGGRHPGAGAHGVPRHILEYGNDFDRSSNAKPHAAARLELFVELVPVGVPIPTHPWQLSGGPLWYLRSYSTSRFEVEFPVFANGMPAMVVYWGRWADARGGVGPFSATCVARMEGGTAPGIAALSEPMYFGARPALPGALPGVSRMIEPRQYAMLESREAVTIEAPRQLESGIHRRSQIRLGEGAENAKVIEQKLLDAA
jgi:hypothetical protein